jgi:hypothetical protein
MQLSVELTTMGAAAFLMIRSGLHSRLLERSRYGICPSCGRTKNRGVCEVCSRPAR